MADEQRRTTSGAIFNPRSEGTTGIGGSPPVEVSPKKGGDRKPGGNDGSVLVLFTLLVLGLAGFMLYSLEGAALVDPAQRAARGEVDSAADIALTRPARLKTALETIDANLPAGGYIENFRLAPDRINAIVVDPSGLRRSVGVNPALDLTSSDAGSADSEGLGPKDIPASVPEQILESAERRYGLARGNFDYMVVSAGADPTWVAFWKQPLKGNQLMAQLDGSQLRRLGEPVQ